MSDLTGKVAIVTGGNSGIGKEAAVGIAQAGAHVVIAARNPAKAAAALTEIETRADARGRVETIPIDLASFASVREFVDAFNAKHDRLVALLGRDGTVRELTEVLARGIRDGSLDAPWSDLVESVRGTVRAKLEVANPGYTGRPEG